MENEDLKFIIERIDKVRDELNESINHNASVYNRKLDEIIDKLDEKADCKHQHEQYINKDEFFINYVEARDKYSEKQDDKFLRKSKKLTTVIDIIKAIIPYAIIVLLMIYNVLRPYAESVAK